MNECKTCKHEGEICPSVSHYQGVCDGWEPKPVTNADRIRAMTDEELARWIADDLIEPGYFEGDSCYELWIGWLKREAQDG